jgi:hypothetical protein
VVIAWTLYIFFKPVSTDLSLLTAWFRLVYATILGVALVNFFLVLQLVGRAQYQTLFVNDHLNAQVMVYLDAFKYGRLVGLVCFGIHLLLLGYLVCKPGYVPRILGILLVLAGVGYLIDTLANALLANYEDYQPVFLLIVAVPSAVGELAFALWLLLRGGTKQAALH